MNYSIDGKAFLQLFQARKEYNPVTEEILLGDVITTRKSHPCGSSEWTVIRTGADIKIRCNGCGRIVMLDRESFLRRRKAVLSRGVTQENPCQ